MTNPIPSAEALESSVPEPAGNSPVREFKLPAAFALAFLNVSPIVGIYSVFAIGLALAGPGFIWAFPVVLIGQLLVAGVFGDLVSRWPRQGSVYAWARELIGARFGWFTNWAYMWGLTITLSALALAAAQFLLGALGVTGQPQIVTVLVGVGILVFASLVNSVAGVVLKVILYISVAAELTASLGIGTALMFFHHHNSWSVVFDGLGDLSGAAWMFGPFIAALAFVGFSFVGFESAGSIAEEVQGARKVLPKAIVLSLLAAGIIVTYAVIGILLAVPDLGSVLSGANADPVTTTLTRALGPGVGQALLVALAIGFISALIAVQTAVTRSIWAGARDRVLPASGWLGRLRGKERIPVNATILTAVIAIALLFISSTNVYSLLVSFANIGFYVSYAFPVLGLAYVHLRKRWTPGPTSMGRWSAPVTYIAAVWLVFEVINIAWPRPTTGTWYLDWGVLIMAGVLAVTGALVVTRIFRNGEPVSDASTEFVDG